MTTLVVFARAPVLGQVKTRLAARVGDQAALALHRAFVDDVCGLAAAVPDAGVARRVLAVAGDPALLADVAARHGMTLEAQAPGDLGARMDQAIRSHAPACILGSDSPSLPVAHLREALARLDGSEVVIGPSGDGGYWLIGARRPVPELFDGIAWSTPAVLPETLRRLDGRRAALLPFWYDVDDAEDLALLAAHLRHLGDEIAPATRAALSSAHLL